MRGHFIVIAMILSYFLVSYKYSKMYEGFESEEEPEEKKEDKILFDIDKMKYGYLNTFYEALSKEPLEVLKEPLPLQDIPKVPLNSSKKTKEECKNMLKITTLNVNKNDKKKIRENRRDFEKYDKDPLKPFLDYCNKNKLKYNRDRINKVLYDCAIISLRLKKINNRPRPYQLCFAYGQPIQYLRSEKADTPSFPSSYALQSYVIAYLLGNKYTKHQVKFEDIADRISWSRVHSGNNFESDIECSKAILMNLRNYLDTIEV
jgi:hypothetical protein